MSAVLLALSLSPAQAWDEAPDVLFVGNSYTYYNDLDVLVQRSLSELVPAYTKVHVERRTAGSLKFPDHLARIEGGDAAWVDAFDKSQTWDVVVFQDHSQAPGLSGVSSIYDASYAAFPQLDGYAARTGADTVLYMTWGRRDGSNSYPEHFPDFPTMAPLIDAGYRAFAANPSTKGRVISIGPVGRAFAAVYARLEAEGKVPETTGSDFHRLYNSDGTHPSRLGSGIAAGVFAATLTGWFPAEDQLPGVGDGDASWAVDAIGAAVVPFGELSYPWAVPWGDYEAPGDLDKAPGTPVISGLLRCTTAGVDADEGTVAGAAVGGSHGGVAGCGRIWVVEGGQIQLDDLHLGVAGVGELRVSGGTVGVDGVTLGSKAGEGRLVVSGGEVVATGISHESGSIRVQGGRLTIDGWVGPLRVATGGALEAEPGAHGGGLDLDGGTVTLGQAPKGPALALTESSTLAGTLVVPELTGTDEVVLVQAPSLDHDRLLVELPADWEWSATKTTVVARLIVDDTGTPPTDTGDAGTEPTDDGSTDAPVNNLEPTGCGCASRGAPPLGSVLWLGLFGLWRRRR